ncbi:hypothetical protein ACH5RR_040773 [Cinchona calisaya]|uniref:Uncharacterized protein n=1 Tax=Cinchona calisaya TaxID=153742 RepID=A0ABD2XUA2_9GENT
MMVEEEDEEDVMVVEGKTGDGKVEKRWEPWRKEEESMRGDKEKEMGVVREGLQMDDGGTGGRCGSGGDCRGK